MRKYYLLIVCLFVASLGQAQEELSVLQAIEKALENNYDIKLISRNYEVTKVQNTWGMAGLSPTFSLNIGNTASLQDNTNNPATFFPGVLFNDNLQGQLNMAWTVFSGFGIRINKDRFDMLQAQTKGNAVVVIETTIHDVILAYYTAVVQERKLSVLKDLIGYSKDKLEYHRVKSEMGISTTLDLLEFESQVLTDSTNYLLQQLSLKNSLRNLNLLMAQDLETDYIMTDSLDFSTSVSSFEELHSAMIQDNQNLKNQYINYELKELEIDAKRSAYFPIITLNLGTTPSVGYFELFGDQGFSSNTNAWSHAATINIRQDIFQGMNRRRNVQIAEIQRDIALLQVEDLEQDLSHQLLSTYELYQVRIKVKDMAVKKLKYAAALWRLGREKYSVGLINVFNLNDIKLSYEQAVLNYYDRLFEVLQTHYDLMRMSGQITQKFKVAENFDKED